MKEHSRINRRSNRSRLARTAAFMLAAAMLCLIASPAKARGTETVRVGYFAFEGYHEIDEYGKKSGYGYELLQYMAGYTDWEYEYVGYEKSWSEMQEMLLSGEIDMLSSAQKTEAREELFDFSDEAVGVSSAILTVDAGNTEYMTTDYADWSGVRIGLLEGNSRNDDLAAFALEKGFTYTPVYYSGTSALIEALHEGADIDAAVTSDLRSVKDEWVLAKFAPSNFYIMVRKGNSELLDEINKALSLLFTDHPNLRTELAEKYYTPDSGDTIAFSAEEREFITDARDSGTVFSAVINPDRAPLSYFEDGVASGTIGDIAREIIARSDLNIEIIEPADRAEYLALIDSGTVDICFDFERDFNRAEATGYRITSAYMKAGVSLLYMKGNSARGTLGLVADSYIGSDFENHIRRDYDGVIYYDSVQELVTAVKGGECDAGGLYTRVCEQLVLDDPRNQLASKVVYGSKVEFAVAVDGAESRLLFSILDKAVSSLGEDYIEPVVQEYASNAADGYALLSYIYNNPLAVAIAVAAAFFVLILIIGIILINRKRRDDARRLKAETRKNALLSDALDAATKADEAKSQFLSRVSHEMRTPLNAIIGFMELAKDAAPEQRMGYRDNSLIAAKQLLNVINDVLDMSAISSGKLKIASAPFDLKELIHSVTNIYAAQCGAKGLEFESVLESPVDEWLVGDRLRLNQILMNLLGNAVKFTDKGFVRLSVSQRAADDERVFLHIEVSDSGCGMSADMLSRLGKPFEQADADTANKHGGSGLGLSIVTTLVSMMEGAFKAESEPGHGSVFTVDIPFTRSDAVMELHLPDGASGLNVLAVDDLKTECDYLAMMLTRIGVKHTCMECGDAALLELDRAHDSGDAYNVCLIDWKMPDMDGVELTRRIREKYGRDVIVIVISAYEPSKASVSAKKAGADMFVAKPLFQSSLFDLFMTLTGGQVTKLPDVKRRRSFPGKRILLAEDNAMNRMVAEALINKLDIECDTAYDGREAVDKLLSSAPGHYDAVLMDIQMPNMDGYEATRAIRESAHPEAGSMPIIAFSANAFNEDVAKSLSMGMNDHLAKPIDMDKLTDALERAFRRHGGLTE